MITYVIVPALCFGFGILVGSFFEWRRHCETCNCRGCVDYRRMK